MDNTERRQIMHIHETACIDCNAASATSLVGALRRVIRQIRYKQRFSAESLRCTRFATRLEQVIRASRFLRFADFARAGYEGPCDTGSV